MRQDEKYEIHFELEEEERVSTIRILKNNILKIVAWMYVLYSVKYGCKINKQDQKYF